MASTGRSRVRRFEQRFDRVLGQLRLIAILLVRPTGLFAEKS
jgi:branched-subunit amino acid ABC-type transport system permease component